MKKLLRTTIVLIIAAALTGCGDGSSGSVSPPLTKPAPSSTSTPAPTPTPNAPTPASVTQWASGDVFAQPAITVSFTTAPAAGDVLLVALWNNGQGTGDANTYTPPADWTLVDQNTADRYASYQLYSHVVGAADTNSYAFAPLATDRQHVWMAADIAQAGAVDQSGDAFVNGTDFTTPSLTPANTSDLAITFDMPIISTPETWTNPDGWTVGSGPTTMWSGETLVQTLSSTSAVSSTATLSAAAPGYSALVLVSPGS